MNTWKDCIAKKYIIKTKPNRSMAIQMERMALLREDFLQHHVDEKFLILKLEAYYDIIKELLYSHLYKNGFSCDNPKYLAVYSAHHFHLFKEENKLIQQLFAMKERIHKATPKEIQEFLQKNKFIIRKTIELLKERLVELA